MKLENLCCGFILLVNEIFSMPYKWINVNFQQISVVQREIAFGVFFFFLCFCKGSYVHKRILLH